MHVQLKKWTIKYKWLYLLNHVSYFNNIKSESLTEICTTIHCWNTQDFLEGIVFIGTPCGWILAWNNDMPYDFVPPFRLAKTCDNHVKEIPYFLSPNQHRQSKNERVWNSPSARVQPFWYQIEHKNFVTGIRTVIICNILSYRHETLKQKLTIIIIII